MKPVEQSEPRLRAIGLDGNGCVTLLKEYPMNGVIKRVFLLTVAFLCAAAGAQSQTLQMHGIDSGTQIGGELVLKGVKPGAGIVISRKINTAENGKIVLRLAHKLRQSPTLSWKLKGSQDFVGRELFGWTGTSYEAIANAHPDWNGEIEELVVVFPRSEENIRIQKVSIEPVNMADELSVFVRSDGIATSSMNYLVGPKLHGFLWLKVIGCSFLLMAIAFITWRTISSKNRFEKSQGNQISINYVLGFFIALWLVFDLSVNIDIYKKFQLAKMELSNGNYSIFENFLPALNEANLQIKDKRTARIQYIGKQEIVYWHLLHLRYKLMPARISTDGDDKTNFYFLFDTPFIFNRQVLTVKDQVVCDSCSLIFEKPGVSFFGKNQSSLPITP